MKNRVLLFVFVLGISQIAFSQNARLIFKNGEIKTEKIQAFSSTKLFLQKGSVDFASIESIYFASEDAVDGKLNKQLSQAGIKILYSKDVADTTTEIEIDSPKQGDRTLILVCQDSAAALFKRIGQHLAAKGYGIDYSSAELLTIKTSFRPIAKPRYLYFLNVVVVGNRVIITAQWKTTRSEVFDWIYSSKKGNFKSRVSQVLHNDLIKNLDGFHRLETVYP